MSPVLAGTRHGELNPATLLALVIVISFVGHLPLVAGFVSWRDRGWRRYAFWACLFFWFVLVVTVTHVLRRAV